MEVLVTGGASSGKSAFAEQVACSLPGPHVYLATMGAAGAEAQARIARHRAQRGGKGFSTVEVERSVSAAGLPSLASEGTVLLEDLGNLVANELFAPARHIDAGQVGRAVAGQVRDLAQRCANLVVVTAEVGCDGVRYDAETAAYVEQLGAASCAIAQRCDVVVEVTAGCPVVLKGALPWT